MAFIRSISGIRATIGSGLNIPELSKYLIAFANLYGSKGIVFGNDGRKTGVWLSQLAESVFTSLNIPFLNIGIAPTPTIMLLTEKFDFSGGLSITASHNPIQWNGLKFIGSSGVFLNQEENNKIWDLVDNNTYESTPLSLLYPEFIADLQNKIANDRNWAINYHIDSVLKLDIFKTNLISIQKYFQEKKFKVVVDAVNASGSLIVPRLLSHFGVQVIELYCTQGKDFPHTPEPLLENLTELINEVKTQKANLGISVDPDSDRLVVIDQGGKAIGEENTIVASTLSLLSYLQQSQQISENSSVVINSSTTSMVEKVVDSFGLETYRSAVGEINVVELMKEKDAVIGGEGSGGVILPSLHYSRDAMVGISLILYLISSKETNLLELILKIGQTSIIKDKQHFNGTIEEIIDRIKSEFPTNKVIVFDGVKVFISKYEWVQLRKSNTEPIIRIIAEAEDKSTAEKLINRVKKCI